MGRPRQPAPTPARRRNLVGALDLSIGSNATVAHRSHGPQSQNPRTDKATSRYTSSQQVAERASAGFGGVVLTSQKSSSAVVRTLVLTDLVSSTKLVETLGDELSREVGERHDRLARDLLVEFDGQEIDKTDGFLMLFERPLDAVEFSLRYHQELDRLSREMDVDLRARVGIHLGEVFLRENPAEHVARGAKPLEVEGLAKPTAARVMSLAQGRQTLLTGAAFDLAKRGAVGKEIAGGDEVEWVSHGHYRFKGVAQPLEVFEAGIPGLAPLSPPPATEKACPVADATKPFTEGSEINGRYQILCFQGDSRDGRVYRAYDRHRNTDVTVVEIDTNASGDASRRARWEGMLSASESLNHPNLVDLHELDESGDRPLLIFQYVEGQPIDEWSAAKAPPANDVLARLLRQVSDGLAAAHGQGLIHGNLGSGDILVDRDGFAFVSGVGGYSKGNKADPAELDPDTISPEAVRGKALAPSCDIFAVGCIFHRLATGSPPYPGPSPHEKMIQRLEGPPPAASRTRPDLAPLLDRTIGRCLAPLEKRIASFGEVEKSLQPLFEGPPTARRSSRRPLTLAISAALVAVVAVLAWALLLKGPSATEPAQVPVVAVVPFDNRTGDRQLDWLGEGLARLVSDRLGKSKHLRVASRGRVNALLEESSGDSRKLSEKLTEGSIGFLLNGEILPSPSNGFTVAARLIDNQRQEQVESKQVAGLGTEELLQAAEPISLAVRRGLNVPLADEVDVFAADFATRNPQAYEAFVEGMRAWTAFDYDRAEKAFDTALQRAPDYKMARFRRASLLAETGRLNEAQTEIRATLADTAGLTDVQVRYIKASEAWWSGRYDEAIAIYRDLLREYPYETEARYSLAVIFAYDTRRYGEAVEELKRLARIEPEVHSTWSMLGQTQLHLRDFEGAVESLQRYVELEHGSPNSHELLGDSYRCRNEFKQAVAEYEKALEMDPTFASAAIKLAVTEFLMGESEQAERRLRTLTSDRRLPPRQRLDSAFELVSIMSAQGRFREAAFFLEALQQPLQEEKVRLAMGLSTRGRALLELGDIEEAARLIDEAIENSPGVPTRYLFARGLLELGRRDYGAVAETVSQILAGALPSDNPDRTEEKAAHYLAGMAALAEGRTGEAVSRLSQSVELGGYRYAIYRAGLARALLEAGEHAKALEQALQATSPLDPVEPRLDLELDRRKALLTLAEVQRKSGRKVEAEDTLGRFVELWSKADSDVADWGKAAESGS